MPSSPHAVVSLYLAAFLSLWGAVHLRHDNETPVYNPLTRGLGRGELSPGIPRLDPDDAMANAALLRMALNEVGIPGLDEKECTASPRSFSVLLAGRLSHVRFGARAVCQLRRLKKISVGQAARRGGLGELAAFILGRRVGTSRDVDVTRVIVPPFRFRSDSVALVDADLGPLLPREQLIGTWHTHPDGDLEEGILSTTDLHFIRYGYVDFHGQVGALRRPCQDVDWLFDIVEPRNGDWNVYAHDRDRLEELRQSCEADAEKCPLDDLRLTGSRFYLFTRFFDEKSPVDGEDG
jgi:hypothetical protein